MGDMSAIGCTGIVVVATRGTSGPGEVMLSIRGSTEAYLAWSDEPIAKDTRVLVVDVRGPHTAAIQRQAQISQSQARQVAAEAEQESLRNQAEYVRQTAIVQAQYKAEVDQAQASAAQAGPLAAAKAQQEVLAAQTELAQRNAELRQQQLVAEIVKPAEAEAAKVRVLAVADAERTRIQAEAAASHNRVALDRMLIDQLPLIVREASAGLNGANVNILNGATGLGEMAASLVGQGLTIYESIRGNLGQPADDAPDPDETPQLGAGNGAPGGS